MFTSYGVLSWLPDLKGWAEVVRKFLKPGGTFYIVELHPALMTLEFEDGKISYPYFNTGEPIRETLTGTYADRDANVVHDAYFWFHSLENALGPLLGEGLILNTFREFDYLPLDRFVNLNKRAPGEFVYGDFGAPFPNFFSLKLTG